MLILFLGEEEKLLRRCVGGVWCVCGVPNILLAFFVCVSVGLLKERI